MILLILRPHVVFLIIGWDGLGVTSFLLVIYFNSTKSFNAGFITLITNRVGDALLLISIATFFISPSFNSLVAGAFRYDNVILWFLVLATITKSAQIPFSAWLPAAMAAPTPVSALVHSSTLVTAGVYLLVRFHGFFSITINATLVWVGLLTLLLAGLRALAETDMKKIVALSTLRQLGLITFTVGISLPLVAFFHLLAHAYFKALLFISVGNCIHLARGNQDLRFISLNRTNISWTLRFSIIANFSLIGLPFMRGFYSKDLILEARLQRCSSFLEVFLLILSVRITATYTLRFLLFSVWAINKSAPLASFLDNDKTMLSGMSLLWPFAFFGGRLLIWTLFPEPNVMITPWRIKILILIIICTGVFLAFSPKLLNPTPSVVYFSWGNIWALPWISRRAIKGVYPISDLVYGLDLTWFKVGISIFSFQLKFIKVNSYAMLDITVIMLFLIILVIL